MTSKDKKSAPQALLIRLFADFLLSRQLLLDGVGSDGKETLKPLLRTSARCFLELAREMMPGTPDDILIELTKNIVLNTCRQACRAEQSGGELDAAKVIDLLLGE